MKTMLKIVTAAAVSLLAASGSHAMLIPVNVDITQTYSGIDTGSATGSAAGTYSAATGQLLFSGSVTGLTDFTSFTIDANWDVTGLVGTFTNTACTSDPAALFDVCAGGGSIPPTPINVPLPIPLVSNTVDNTGNGILKACCGQNPDSLYTETQWTVSSVPIPVPATAWLIGSVLLGLGVLKRKKA